MPKLEDWREKFEQLVADMEDDGVFFYCADNVWGDRYPVISRGGDSITLRERNYPNRT